MEEERLYDLICDTANKVNELRLLRARMVKVTNEVDNFVLQKGECCYDRIWDKGTDGELLVSAIKTVINTQLSVFEGYLYNEVDTNVKKIREGKW